jgi:hypothetical protein
VILCPRTKKKDYTVIQSHEYGRKINFSPKEYNNNLPKDPINKKGKDICP